MSKWNPTFEFSDWKPALDGVGFPYRSENIPEDVYDEYVFERSVECHWNKNSPFKYDEYNDYLLKRKSIFSNIIDIAESGLEVVLAANLCIGLNENEFIVPQVKFGRCRVDFCILRKSKEGVLQVVSLEADGEKYHQNTEKDKARDAWLHWQGVNTIRFPECFCQINKTDEIEFKLDYKNTPAQQCRLLDWIIEYETVDHIKKFTRHQSDVFRRKDDETRAILGLVSPVKNSIENIARNYINPPTRKDKIKTFMDEVFV